MDSKPALAHIQKGEIAVIPTDTLYGIVGSAFSKQAVEKIYAIKGRDENKPFIVLISSVSDLKKFGITLSAPQKKFLSNVWPNPVSVILSCSSKKFEYLHRGTKSLAFRFPKSKPLQQFIKKTGPLVAPSANPQGEKPAETIIEAKKYFEHTISLYVSGGRKTGKPSTIVDWTGNVPRIIRQGAKKINLTS